MDKKEMIIILYYVDDIEGPFLTKVYNSCFGVTLMDFKNAIPQKYIKHLFFFKEQDPEFGIVKAQIIDDWRSLPIYNGKIESWLVKRVDSSPLPRPRQPCPRPRQPSPRPRKQTSLRVARSSMVSLWSDSEESGNQTGTMSSRTDSTMSLYIISGKKPLCPLI